MLVRQFDFTLPPELIAQEPPRDRDAARLLHLSRQPASIDHAAVHDLPRLLHAGDVLVVNDTRVFPARLLGQRTPSGGAAECLLVGRVEDGGASPSQQTWEALVHPGQKLRPGAQLTFGQPVQLRAEVLERRTFGRRLVRLWTDDGRTVDDVVDAIGHVPLPPYIKRPDDVADRDRYQTIFADHRGSVAAPTAGLHFSGPLLQALHDAGVEIVSLTLHVGYGTFQPVRVDEVEQHRLESERFAIGDACATAIDRARAEGRRVIAVGTTTTRTLEAVARAHAGQVVAGEGTTDLFIYPGYEFQVISGLFTNFHVPRSSLLMLVSAFGGVERVRDAYRIAVFERYRFYSYGDAMLVT